jgi:dihydroxyacetone kinase-like predicted kinase
VNAVAAVAGTLDGLRLNFALQAGLLRLLSKQEHLNKINVFPVPDGDTGTNLALTARAVLATLRRRPEPHVGSTLTRVADAALDGARGNSGAILAQFSPGSATGSATWRSSTRTTSWKACAAAPTTPAKASPSRARARS